jgi:hypothetical protein
LFRVFLNGEVNLTGRKPVLEGVHIAGRSAFAFQSCHFVSSHVAGFIFPQLFTYGEVVAKQKKSVVFSSG